MIAIAFAVSVGVLVQELRKLWGWWRARAASRSAALSVAADPTTDAQEPGEQEPGEQPRRPVAARAFGEARDR